MAESTSYLSAGVGFISVQIMMLNFECGLLLLQYNTYLSLWLFCIAFLTYNMLVCNQFTAFPDTDI